MILILMSILIIYAYLFFSDDSRWCDPEHGVVLNDVDNNVCWQKIVGYRSYFWDGAQKYCDELDLGNKDWILPSKEDFEKKIDYIKQQEVSDNLGDYLTENHNFLFYENRGYWSNIDQEDLVYMISMIDGRITRHYVENILYTSSLRVICVSYK